MPPFPCTLLFISLIVADQRCGMVKEGYLCVFVALAFNDQISEISKTLKDVLVEAMKCFLKLDL